MYSYSFFHGNALLRLVHAREKVSIQLLSGNNCYCVDSRSFMYLKHSTKRISPWQFTFSLEELEELRTLHSNNRKVFIVLICNDDGICCLSYEEISRLIFIGDGKVKFVSVSRSPREKYSVHGSDGQLLYKIGNTDYPEKIFQQ